MQANNLSIDFFWMITTVLILILSGLMIGLFYTFQTKLIAHNQAITDLREQHEKNIMQAQLEMQEIIFQNISHEIHDNVIHSITLTNLQLSMLSKNAEDSEQKLITGLMSGLSETVFHLKNISKGLNRDIIQQQGLLTALEMEIDRLKKLNLFKISFQITGEPIFLDNDKELILFRIVQEAFQNIIKHAHASTVTLKIDYQQFQLHMTIGDDGVGLPDKKTLAAKVSSSGLGNIRNRIKFLTGSYTLNSSNSGTTFSILIPYT
ncbi:MAG: hypothetical protein EOO09_14450 [Chitinophagaceae bacterium]|nr:MAG: hypothetical protein EOO09_14450 [Chitinophagaceae bacterium]